MCVCVCMSPLTGNALHKISFRDRYFPAKLQTVCGGGDKILGSIRREKVSPLPLPPPFNAYLIRTDAKSA